VEFILEQLELVKWLEHHEKMLQLLMRLDTSQICDIHLNNLGLRFLHKMKIYLELMKSIRKIWKFLSMIVGDELKNVVLSYLEV
jgi:hypothetical protein